MSENWFYRVFGEEFGPVSLNDLREFATNGTMSGNDEVRPEALTMWVPAKVVRELQDLYQETIESGSTVTSNMNAAAAAPTVTDEWYYRMTDGDGAEVGPLTFDALIELAKSGRLTSDDEVRLGVDRKWRRAGSMGRLVAVLPYQTRRRNVAPAPPETQADPLKEMISALPEVVSEDVPSAASAEALPEVVSEEPVVERKTPRPKSASRAEPADAAPNDRATPRPKSRRVSKKQTQPVAAEAENAVADADEAVPAGLEQDIEDQILEELMTPSAAKPAATVPTSMPAASPASPSSVESLPQDSWATTPHVMSPASASFNRPTPTPITRPSVKPFKPARSGPSLLERFKDPKVLGGLAILVPLLLIGSWIWMPESSAADIHTYQTLEALFAELRETRKNDPDGKKVIPIGKKLETTAKEVAAKLKKTADAEHPARQCLLWVTKSVPAIVKNGLGGESPSEKEALSHLKSAAVALGLQEPPPPVTIADTANEP